MIATYFAPSDLSVQVINLDTGDSFVIRVTTTSPLSYSRRMARVLGDGYALCIWPTGNSPIAWATHKEVL